MENRNFVKLNLEYLEDLIIVNCEVRKKHYASEQKRTFDRKYIEQILKLELENFEFLEGFESLNNFEGSNNVGILKYRKKLEKSQNVKRGKNVS